MLPRVIFKSTLDRSGYFFHRATAAFLAISRRFLVDRPCARASPPLRPNSTAALLLPSSVVSDSSISPVAIFMTWTAFETTSAGRLWPFGVRGMLSGKLSIFNE
jgi:hypothetical protein